MGPHLRPAPWARPSGPPLRLRRAGGEEASAGTIAPAGPDFEAAEAAGPDFEAAGPDFEAAGPDFEAGWADWILGQMGCPWPIGRLGA